MIRPQIVNKNILGVLAAVRATVALIIMLFAYAANATNVDSLRLELSRHNAADTTRTNLLLAMGDAYRRANTDSVLLYATQALSLSVEQHFDRGQMKSLHLLGNAYVARSNMDSGAHFLYKALKIAEQLGDAQTETRVLMAVGNMHYGKGELDSALSLYKKSYAISKRAGDSKNTGATLMNIACIYSDNRKYTNAIDCYLQSMKILEAGNHLEDLANCYSNVASFYLLMGDYKKSLDYNRKSEELYEKTGNIRGSLGTVCNQGIVLAEMSQFAQAEALLLLGIHRADSVADMYWRNVCIVNLAGVYFNMGRCDSAIALYRTSLSHAEKTNNSFDIAICRLGIGQCLLRKNQTAAAITELLTAYKIFTEIGLNDPTYKAAEELSKAYEAQHNIEKALAFKKIYCDFKDSITIAKNDRKIQQVLFDYELEKQEHKIKELQAEKLIAKAAANQHLLLIYSFGIGILLLVAIVFLLFRSRRMQLKANEQVVKKNVEIEKHVTELESLNQYKNKTFSIISHDLKGPVNALASAVNMVNNGMISYDDLKTFMPEMGQKLNSMSLLLNNLLLWAKGSMEGNAGAKPVDTLLSPIVNQNIDLLRDSANNKSISLANEAPDNIAAFCDPSHLDIIVRNLIANAIKFSNANGSVTVAATNANGKVSLTVTDTGVGMTKEQLNNLFIPAQNNSTFGTAGEKGTGIGLLLCFEYVKANKGTIVAKSEPGKGTTVTVTLPEKQ